jgi:hypothetical protein
MVSFGDWCNIDDSMVGVHSIKVLSGRPEDLPKGHDAISSIVPTHYASEEHIARNLARLGKAAAADFIRQKLPTSRSIRSGDLGEILATEYIANQTTYTVPVKRLRWKDHRNMAMRGDDVIGFAQDPATGRLFFLKTEVKSRASLATAVVVEAREALDKDNGLPSAHALSFISARLLESGNTALADAIDDEQLKYGISPQAVTHLLFTFSGNSPIGFLSTSLAACAGAIPQLCVGLRIDDHKGFISAVYDLVIQNAIDD